MDEQDGFTMTFADWRRLVEALNHFQYLDDVGALTAEEQPYIAVFQDMRRKYGIGWPSTVSETVVGDRH